MTSLLVLPLLYTPFLEDEDEEDEEGMARGREEGGLEGGQTHMRTVQSSEADAIMSGREGFHVTQFTERVCPLSVSSSAPCSRCHR